MASTEAKRPQNEAFAKKEAKSFNEGISMESRKRLWLELAAFDSHTEEDNKTRSAGHSLKNFKKGISTAFLDARSSTSSDVRRWAARVVKGPVFVGLVATLLVANAVYLAVEMEIRGPTEDWWAWPWYPTEVGLSAAFLGEFCFRLTAEKSLSRFVADGWNVFDFVIVSLSCLATFVLHPFTGYTSGTQFNVRHAVDLVRLARLVRLFRLFRELWKLISGIVGAMKTLLWTWLLLALVIYICGIVTTRTIGQPHKDLEFFQTYFGTVPRSMLTLFQVTTTDRWSYIVKECMLYEQWSIVFFVAYLYGTTYAVLNVVVAVIVENTLDSAGDQRKKFLEKQQLKQKGAAVGIYDVFRRADVNNDGCLKHEEFDALLQEEDLRKYLSELGINPIQAENLFCILDVDDNGSLDAEEFAGGVMKAIGLAQARDVLALECGSRRTARKLIKKLEDLEEKVMTNLGAAEQGLDELRTCINEVQTSLLAKGLQMPKRSYSRKKSRIDTSTEADNSPK